MSILQPFFLGFLALALIPLILYLIFRLRKHEVAWGATYILRLTINQKKRQNLWKQIVVLSLRTIMLALLALAFARPFLAQGRGGGQEYPRGPQRLHRIVLVDNSQSMLASAGSRTRLDDARAALTGLVAGLRAGDVCGVAPLAPAKPGEPIAALDVPCPSTPDAASAIAARIAVSAEPIDLAAAVRAALASFRDVAAPQRQLIVISDYCRADHPAIDGYDVLGEQLRALGVRTAGLNLGLHDASNLAIESVGSGSELFLPGQLTNLYVDIVNFGDARSPQAKAQILVDGKPFADQVVALPPGGRKRLVFPVALEAGRRRIEVKVDPDALPGDNDVVSFVEARPEVNVLIVTPFDPKAEGFGREGEFLRRALESAAETPSRMKTQVLGANNFIPQDLAGRDVVILCGVPEVPAEIAAGLEQLVRRGGGLLVACGPAVVPAKLNASLKGLLPAELDEPARGEIDPERYTNIQASDIPILLLREFEESQAGDLGAARVYNHIRVKPAPAAGEDDALSATLASASASVRSARPLLSLVTGGPLLLERQVGKGVTLLWTTSLGGSWTSLPVHHAYLPLLVRVVNYAAGFSGHPRNLAPNDAFIADVTDTTGALSVTTPDTRLVSAGVVASAGRRFVRFEDTAAPGVYELQDSAGHVLAPFWVARPMHESDIRGLEPAQVRRLEQALDLRLASDVPGLRAALWRPGDGREFTAWFVLLALALVALDALLTWSWFR
ncbi:MAG: VWA domain-containing protein [Planctomycetota bacterium]|nr:VWA domain-containing protein [Planctomycetota bacterium]